MLPEKIIPSPQILRRTLPPEYFFTIFAHIRFVRNMKFLIISSLILSLSFYACNRNTDLRLNHIEQIVNTDPQKALTLLDSINPKDISEDSRHLYDFLSIKAQDKALVIHTNDSLIKETINYYSKHNKSLYPEVLYYGGRVYDDMGDFPTALKYYQNALEIIPSGKEYNHLKGNILSQIGSLLQNLRLFNDAIPYVKQVIELDSIENDSINLYYDKQLLGTIYINTYNYTLAESNFNDAINLGLNLSPSDKAFIEMKLASIKSRTGDINSALPLIRSSLRNIHPIYKSEALVYAANIYKAAGILDSAYIYARQLIEVDDANHLKGYKILLSNELRSMISPDSINIFYSNYKDALDNALNKYDAQASIMQNSYFNYNHHEKDRITAENEKNIYKYSVITISFFVLILTIVILLLKIKNKNQMLQLHEAINNINILKNSLTDSNINEEPQYKQNVAELKSRLQKYLSEITNIKDASTEVSPIIRNSEAYKTLIQYANEDKFIPTSNPIWDQLETIISQVSPNFKYHIQLLIGEDFKEQDFHLAMLIKCGIKPTQLISLLGRTKGTISYHRENLGSKIAGVKMSAKLVDKIIHSI
jgi:tetratricopeptide (TPR) repeat protein